MLAHDRVGTGIPLVFIHAFPLSKEMWNPAKEKLGKNFQVITIDLPGFGGSPLTKDISTMEDMARDVLQTLDGLEIKEKFILTGVSMGGYVMFQMLKQASDKIRGLVFVSTRSTPDTEEVREGRKRTIELVKERGLGTLTEKMIPKLVGETTLKSRPEVIEEVKGMIMKGNPDAIGAALRGMAIRGDSTQFLQNINVPTMVVSGEEDTFTLPSEMSQMTRLIPRARFENISKAGHLLPIEQPDLFYEAFSKYLKRTVL